MKLLEAVNRRLMTQYKVSIDFGSIEEFMDDLRMTLDNDVETLHELNHGCIVWMQYMQDIASMLSIYIDQYSNVLDIYDYLSSIANVDADQFDLVAPKYKISTTSRPVALQELDERIEDVTTFLKALRLLLARVESHISFLNTSYYRTSKLIFSARSRLINSSN